MDDPLERFSLSQEMYDTRQRHDKTEQDNYKSEDTQEDKTETHHKTSQS
jgi:hypothetical protein